MGEVPLDFPETLISDFIAFAGLKPAREKLPTSFSTH
jgi:hypothetical protein